MTSPTNDRAVPTFWNERYASGDTPWVLEGIPQALDTYLRRTERGAVLILGCGKDHNVIRAFAAAGFTTTAIDFSPAAVADRPVTELSKRGGTFGAAFSLRCR